MTAGPGSGEVVRARFQEFGVGRLGRGRPRREAAVGQDPGNDLGLDDGGEDAHTALAAGTLEAVDEKDAAHEFGPGEATRAESGGGVGAAEAGGAGKLVGSAVALSGPRSARGGRGRRGLYPGLL